MKEYEISNRITGERDLIFGYSYADALKRSGLNEKDFHLDYMYGDDE